MRSTVNTRRFPSDMKMVEYRPDAEAQDREIESPPQGLSSASPGCAGGCPSSTLHHKSRDQVGKPRVFDVLSRTFKHGFETISEFFRNTTPQQLKIEGKNSGVFFACHSPIGGVSRLQIRNKNGVRYRNVKDETPVLTRFNTSPANLMECGYGWICNDYTYRQEGY